MAAGTCVVGLAGAVRLWIGESPPPLSALQPLGLRSWVLPGFWLLAVVALPAAVVAVSAWWGSPAVGERALAAAALLLAALALQIPFVGTDVFQAVMALVAVLLAVLGRLAQRDVASP